MTKAWFTLTAGSRLFAWQSFRHGFSRLNEFSQSFSGRLVHLPQLVCFGGHVFEHGFKVGHEFPFQSITVFVGVAFPVPCRYQSVYR